jgi:hypothetical protein
MKGESVGALTDPSTIKRRIRPSYAPSGARKGLEGAFSFSGVVFPTTASLTALMPLGRLYAALSGWRKPELGRAEWRLTFCMPSNFVSE